jgi:hypothetical protein
MTEIKVIFGLNTTADLTHPQLFIVIVDKLGVGHCKIINTQVGCISIYDQDTMHQFCTWAFPCTSFALRMLYLALFRKDWITHGVKFRVRVGLE